MSEDFAEISPPEPKVLLTASQAQSGPPIEPLTRVLGYDSGEWEKFVDEWVSGYLRSEYVQVLRFTGSKDKGIDVAGFESEDRLLGMWDNYQCKHYAHGLMPTDAWPEIGKMLWYSYKKLFAPPRAYYFIAPRGTGTTLTSYLSNIPLLKANLVDAWAKNVANAITSTGPVKLEGAFLDYVQKFDFRIFKTISPRELIEQHRKTHYFIPRFGGGLPPRPAPGTTPDEIHASESGYVTKLLAAYADHTKEALADEQALKHFKPLNDHFNRQRECFYHAESLRVFVRDKVEPGTFEGLQDEIFHGVVDICDAVHADELGRVKAVTAAAQDMSLEAHPLGQSAFVKDRRGICHQLANDDRLSWKR